MTKENKILIGVAALAAAGFGFLYWKKKQAEKQTELVVEQLPEKIPTQVTKVTILDGNKLLSNGSKGEEVKRLQRLLKVTTADGVFGIQTEAALQNAKGVTAITLNDFGKSATPKPVLTTAKAPEALPKKGAKLMVSVAITNLFNSKKLANGTYTNTGEKSLFGSSLKYGEAAGIFKAATTNGTYLVQKGGSFYFINGKHVKVY